MNRHLNVLGWLALLSILALTPAGFASTTWFGEPQLLVDGIHDGRDVTTVDIDNDGDLDLVYTSRNDDFGNVVLLVNVGFGDYVPLVIDGNFIGATDVEVSDIDGDGALDLAVSGTNRVKWYHNDGGNLFTTHIIAANSSEIYSVQCIDFDFDGDIDVLTGSFDGDRVVYFWNNGYQIFTAEVISDSCEGVTNVEAADFDGDGDLDVAAAGNQNSTLYWFENEGSFPFTTHIISEDVDNVRGISTGDFENDGDIDIAAAVDGDDSYTIFKNDGNGNLYPTVLENNTPSSYDVLMIDIDNDGDEDVFGWSRFNHDIYWYEYDANDAYIEHSVDDSLIGFYGLDVGDLNGDDVPDLLAMVSNLGDQNEIHVWYGARNDYWTEHAVDNSVWGASDVKAGDLDLDGDIDLVGAAKTGDRLLLYENTGDQLYEESEIRFLPGVYALWIEDMDADGYPDILTAASEMNDVRLYTNNGDLTFTELIIDETTFQARSVHAADIDSDGDMDIVATARSDDDVIWYENVNNSYTRHTVDAEFARATDAVGVDLDQDGDTDILACGQIMDELVWYENDGAQQFSKQIIASGQNGMRSAVPVDIDDDGDLDVAGALYAGGLIAWYENDGQMDFARHEIIQNFTLAFDVVAGDIDGNGTMDLAVSSEELDSLGWCANDGFGNFTMHLIHGDYEKPRGLDLADLNGDGRLDLIASANKESQIQWWENTFAIPADPITLTVTPLQIPPIEVPAIGGLLSYFASLDIASPVESFDAWITVTYLTGGVPHVKRVFHNVNPGPGVHNFLLHQNVPQVAPAGDYRISVYTGIFPSLVTNSDSFDFTKNPSSIPIDEPGFDSISLGPVTGMIDGNPGVPGTALLDESGEEHHSGTSSSSLPVTFDLSAAYPNPFNPETTVAVDLPETANLTITVYNITGQQVATLAHDTFSAGTHRLTFDASTLTSGLYFVHASVPGQFNAVRKVTLMK